MTFIQMISLFKIVTEDMEAGDYTSFFLFVGEICIEAQNSMLGKYGLYFNLNPKRLKRLSQSTLSTPVYFRWYFYTKLQNQYLTSLMFSYTVNLLVFNRFAFYKTTILRLFSICSSVKFPVENDLKSSAALSHP